MTIINYIIFSGSSIRYNETLGGVATCGHNVIDDAKRFDIKDNDYIMQPSTFWTKEVWDLVGYLNINLHYVFDWEWFIRARNSGVVFHFTPRVLSLYRIHSGHKTGTGGFNRNTEIFNLYNEFEPKNKLLFIKMLNTQSGLLRIIIKFSKKLLMPLCKEKTEIVILRILYPSFYLYNSNKILGIYRML